MTARLLLLMAIIVLSASPMAADSRSVEADCGSVAVGGNALGNSISIGSVICGIPAEQLEDIVRNRTQLQEKVIKLLEEKLELNNRQVRTALDIVGEREVPPERLGEKLLEIAGRFKTLQTSAAVQPDDDSKIASLKAESLKAIEEGQLAKADELLAAIDEIQVASIDRLARSAAETSARRGEVALTRLRYNEAARHYAVAVSRLPPQDEEDRLRYSNLEVGALVASVQYFGDSAAAPLLIERLHQIETLVPRSSKPFEWGVVQGRLGLALHLISRNDGRIELMEEAVDRLRSSLEEVTRTRSAAYWAATEDTLGMALSLLARQKPANATALFHEAVAAHRAAQEEFTQERNPWEWAMIENALGLALCDLAASESAGDYLEQAVSAFRAALAIQKDTFAGSDAQMGLGIALFGLGVSEIGTAHLEEAIAAYQAALKLRKPTVAPIQWAAAQSLLGTALWALAAREGGTARLKETVAAYRAALEEMTRERAPYLWAEIESKLGGALGALGEREGSTARLEEAISAHRAALEEITRERDPARRRAWKRPFRLIALRSRKSLGSAIHLDGLPLRAVSAPHCAN
jgi:tetratricopeptide (TPR) repeat protein